MLPPRRFTRPPSPGPADPPARSPDAEGKSRMTEPSRAPQPHSSFDDTINRTDMRAAARGGVLPPTRPQRQNMEENL